MIKLDDKNYTRNLHYHFKTDENHYERIDVEDKHIENGVDRSHKYYKEITQCIEFLHQLNSWYEDMKGYDE